MTRWACCFWDEEEICFYFELDADGQVLRQVELQEPGPTPLAAASLDEWQRAQNAGDLTEYEAKYGLTASLSFHEWEGHDPRWLSGDEFESVWTAAREHIEQHSR